MTPSRPFYQRKRWIAAGLLWLALPILYAASLEPWLYCQARGWRSDEAAMTIYAPLSLAIEPSDAARQFFNDYGGYCYRLGQQHAASK